MNRAERRKKRLPPERVLSFVPIARASREGAVVVAVRNADIAQQYTKGVRAAHGDVDNLRFTLIGDELADAFPDRLVFLQREADDA